MEVFGVAMAICPYCDEPAFSSAAFVENWVCPTCGKSVPPETAGSKKKLAIRAERKAQIDRYTRYWLNGR